jgi:hypothetical protein
MKSVLISVDFIYKEDGTLHPTELNTSTKDDITVRSITNENFETSLEGFFDHKLLNSFMINNNLSKIKTIGGDPRLYKAFANYYGFEFESIVVSEGSIIVPEVDDRDDTLIIRIAYDTYALIDDLYARDNYEFHNLIKDESFSSPVTFIENNFDTITEFEPSQDGVIPNYLIKARTPAYEATEYPKAYRLDNVEELNVLKKNLGSNEFIQKYEYNDSLSLIDNRTHHLRTMSLICGPTLEVLNLVQYKSMNFVSTQNELLVYDSEIDINKKLHNLFLSKYYPTFYSKTGLDYHMDETDYILKPDNTLASFKNLQAGDEVKSIFFNKQMAAGIEQDFSVLENPITQTSVIRGLPSSKNGIFVNITATNETYGTFSWYDGIGNTYIMRNPRQQDNIVSWTKAGVIESGDEIMVYDKLTNQVIPLTVQSIFYDIKNINLYKISLTLNPEFLVQLDSSSDLFLIQHNSCGFQCYFGTFYYGCFDSACNDCGKNSTGCINCGGSSLYSCLG